MNKFYIPALLLTGLFLYVLSNGMIEILLDVPSILVVIFFPIVMSFSVWGAKKSFYFLSLPFRENFTKPDLEHAVNFYNSLMIYFLISGVFGFFIGITMILALASKLSEIGPSVAISLLTVIYSMVFILAVVIPFKSAVKKKLIDKD